MLVENGLTAEHLDQLLDLIGAPARIPVFDTVCRTLTQSLPMLSDNVPFVGTLPIKAWQEISTFVTDLKELAKFPGPSLGRSAMTQAITDYPIYAALEIEPNPELRPQILVLDTLLLGLSARKLLGDDTGNTSVELGRVIRMCGSQSISTSDSGEGRYDELVQELPTSMASLDSLARHFDSFMLSGVCEDYRAVILRATQKLLQPPEDLVKALSNQHGSQESIKNLPRIVPSWDRNTETDSTSGDATDPRPSPRWPTNRFLEAGDLELDQSPDADSTEPAPSPGHRCTVVEGERSVGLNRLPDFRDDLDRARGKHRAQGRRNQFFFSDWQYPDPIDLSVFMTELEANRLPLVEGYPDNAIALFCHSVLFCGRAPGSVRVVSSLRSQRPVRDEVVICPSEGGWIAMLPLPEDRYIPTETDREYLELVSDLLELPLPIPLQEAAQPLVGEVIVARNELIKDLNRWLRSLNTIHATRLSISRISLALTKHLHSLTDDRVEMALLSNDGEHQGHSGMYYYSPRRDRLSNLYREACVRLCWDTSYAGPVFGVRQEDKIKAMAVYVGGALRPKRTVIENLVRYLKDLTQERPIRLRSTKAVLEFHQHYTLYTAFLLQFALATRGITLPLRRPCDIDLDAGFAILSDKDYYDASSTRLVPLPEVLCAHLGHWLQHLDAFHARTRLQRPTVNMQTGPLLYLRDPDGKWRLPTPGWQADQVRPVWPLKPDTPRHWYRTALREQGVPAELVDAVMGHGRHMQGAGDQYSSLNPIALRESVAHTLDRLLRDIGWEPIRGLHG